MISEKVQVATTMRPKVAMLTSGMDCSVVAMKRGNARGARGAGHPLYDPFIVANRQRDEPLGCSGGRQPSSGGTSRMTGDRLVRICEGSRVKFLRSTRHEGRPLGIGFQEQISNHSKLLRSKAVVVSVGVKAREQTRAGEHPRDERK